MDTRECLSLIKKHGSGTYWHNGKQFILKPRNLNKTRLPYFLEYSFKYCSLEFVPYIFCFIILLKEEKWSHMGFLRVPNLVPWLIFNVIILGIRAWFFTDQFCWSDQTLLWLGREVIKEIEEGKRVGGGDYFKYIFLKGAIILVRRIIEGRLLFEKCSMCSARLELLLLVKG